MKELLRSREIVIQQQEKALLEQQQTINQQSCMIQDNRVDNHQIELKKLLAHQHLSSEVYFPIHLSGLEELVPLIISSNPML